jgi:hypothetical protein
MLDAIKANVPGAELTVSTILPAGPKFAEGSARIVVLNEEIKKLCADRGVRVIDLHRELVGADGFLRPRYTKDGVHLTLAGYWAWTRAVVGDDLASAAKSFAARYAPVVSTERAITATNSSRGADQLIVYNSDHASTTTKTNPWGSEVVVSGGVVVSAGGGDSAIPADGFVVSGHGSAAEWVAMNLEVGAPLELKNGKLHLGPPEVAKMDLVDRADWLEAKLMAELLSPEKEASALAVIKQIETARVAKDAAAIDALWAEHASK